MTRNLLLASISLVLAACLAGPKQDDPGQPFDVATSMADDTNAGSVDAATATVVNAPDCNVPQNTTCAMSDAHCASDASAAPDVTMAACADAIDADDGLASDSICAEADAGWETGASD